MSFDQLINQFIGGQQEASAASGQPQTNASALSNSIPGGLIGGLAAGGVLGAVIGNKKMRKTATRLAGGAVGLGGAALLGVVAHRAYQNWQQSKPAVQNTNVQSLPTGHASASPETDISKFDPYANNSPDGQPFQLALVKAMIAAAYADGHVDGAEYGKIFEALENLGLDANEKAVVLDLLKNPPSVHEIASLAGGLEQASEIYIASRMAIDPDHPSERAYLEDLAKLMEMPAGLVVHIESNLIEENDKAA